MKKSNILIASFILITISISLSACGGNYIGNYAETPTISHLSGYTSSLQVSSVPEQVREITQKTQIKEQTKSKTYLPLSIIMLSLFIIDLILLILVLTKEDN